MTSRVLTRGVEIQEEVRVWRHGLTERFKWSSVLGFTLGLMLGLSTLVQTAISFRRAVRQARRMRVARQAFDRLFNRHGGVDSIPGARLLVNGEGSLLADQAQNTSVSLVVFFYGVLMSTAVIQLYMVGVLLSVFLAILTHPWTWQYLLPKTWLYIVALVAVIVLNKYVLIGYVGDAFLSNGNHIYRPAAWLAFTFIMSITNLVIGLLLAVYRIVLLLLTTVISLGKLEVRRLSPEELRLLATLGRPKKVQDCIDHVVVDMQAAKVLATGSRPLDAGSKPLAAASRSVRGTSRLAAVSAAAEGSVAGGRAPPSLATQSRTGHGRGGALATPVVPGSYGSVGPSSKRDSRDAVRVGQQQQQQLQPRRGGGSGRRSVALVGRAGAAGQLRPNVAAEDEHAMYSNVTYKRDHGTGAQGRRRSDRWLSEDGGEDGEDARSGEGGDDGDGHHHGDSGGTRVGARNGGARGAGPRDARDASDDADDDDGDGDGEGGRDGARRRRQRQAGTPAPATAAQRQGPGQRLLGPRPRDLLL